MPVANLLRKGTSGLGGPLTIEEENMATLREFADGWGDFITIDENPPTGTEHPLHDTYFKSVDSGHSEPRWLPHTLTRDTHTHTHY